MHFLLCCGCQADWPSLLCPFRCVQGKGVLAFLQNFSYNSDFIQEHVNILRREKMNVTRVNKLKIFLPQCRQSCTSRQWARPPDKHSKESVLGTEGILLLTWNSISRPMPPLISVACMHHPYLSWLWPAKLVSFLTAGNILSFQRKSQLVQSWWIKHCGCLLKGRFWQRINIALA